MNFIPQKITLQHLKMIITKLSILIPAFNEETTIFELLEKVIQIQLNNNIQKEIIVVDDCSTDNTKTAIDQFFQKYPNADCHYFKHEKNMGKGAAISTAIANASGEFCIIQDADLEYNPEEYNDMLKPIITGVADVVYGSRFKGNNPHRILFFWHTIGNKFLTFLSNMFTNLNLSDMETCYKMFRTDLIKKIELKEKRFGLEPEITAKISRIPNIRIYEVGISYYGRTYDEGKKINWKDGVRAIFCILKYGALKRN